MDIEKLVKYVAEASGDPRNEQLLAKLRRQIGNNIDQHRLLEPRLPAAGERVGIDPMRPKTAALAFDRIWAPPTVIPAPPGEVAVYGGTDVEVWLQALGAYGEYIGNDRFTGWIYCLYPELEGQPDTSRRVLAESLRQTHGMNAVPVYSSGRDRATEYHAGSYEVVVGVLANVALVDEEQITWQQVLEFRADSQARADYRRFIHWLDSDMVGKSEGYISDEVSVRLEQYEAGLRKHGVSTVLGGLESVMDPKFIGATSVALAGITFGTGSVAVGAASAVALGVGKIACTVARGMLDISAARTGENAEVAFVHEVRGKLGTAP